MLSLAMFNTVKNKILDSHPTSGSAQKCTGFFLQSFPTLSDNFMKIGEAFFLQNHSQ